MCGLRPWLSLLLRRLPAKKPSNCLAKPLANAADSFPNAAAQTTHCLPYTSGQAAQSATRGSLLCGCLGLRRLLWRYRLTLRRRLRHLLASRRLHRLLGLRRLLGLYRLLGRGHRLRLHRLLGLHRLRLGRGPLWLRYLLGLHRLLWLHGLLGHCLLRWYRLLLLLRGLLLGRRLGLIGLSAGRNCRVLHALLILARIRVRHHKVLRMVRLRIG